MKMLPNKQPCICFSIPNFLVEPFKDLEIFIKLCI